MKNNNKIPPATVKRLPLYLQCLELIDDKTIGISSKKLAELAKVNDAQVRSCLLYTSPSPRDVEESRMPSSA